MNAVSRALLLVLAVGLPAFAAEIEHDIDNGLSTHGEQSYLSFGLNAQLRTPSTHILHVESLNDTRGSYKRNCGRKKCEATGSSLESWTLKDFPSNTSSNNFNARFARKQTLNSEDFNASWASISLKAYSTVTIQNNSEEVLIKQLKLGYSSKLILGSGIYWIEDLNLNVYSKIISKGDGPVWIVTKNVANIGYLSSIKSKNDESAIGLIGYDSINIHAVARINGFIYSNKTLELDFNARIKGALRANQVYLNLASRIYYQPEKIQKLDFAWLLPVAVEDMDGDGIPDNEDDDRDGDGISNDHETQLGFDPNDANSTPADLDGDATPDALDSDIDGDGHLNEVDAFPMDATEWSDLDSDGTGDNADLDRDNDGISNEVEVQLGFDPDDANDTPEDLDLDGTPDALDIDIDGDGHLNEDDSFPKDPEEWADLDSDGTGDNADLDRDGDGISNEYEIQLGFDPNDAAASPADFEGDGIPDLLDNDIDGDNIPNGVDAFPFDSTEWADLDSDGTGDNADLDRDGDGISNEHETQLGFDPNDKTNTPADLDGDATPDAIDTDIDGDGHLNEVDVFPRDAVEWSDLDSDGTGDNADLDRDGDGISNEHETQLGFDPNDKTNTPADLDGDATPDAIDTDIDGDGHLNDADVFPTDSTEWSDLDADGTGDNSDLDRDGDGISNEFETQLGFDPNDKTNTPADLDGDATPDAIDADIDGDGHLNEVDLFPHDVTEWADLDSDGTGDNTDLDRDGDGISNEYEVQLGFDPNDKANTPEDLDGDATPDALDTDIDGDGHLNVADVFPRDATEWSDLDSDGTGDNTDLDRDGDGISNDYETQLGFDPNDKANTPEDLDGDATPDALDTDIDGDGHLNEADVFPRDATEWADLDEDGVGDNADLDRDGDGISNEYETQLGFDPNDETNTPADLDGDATPDAIDTDIDGDGYLNEVDVFPRDKTEWADLDADGTGDNADLDRDGDGISNEYETQLDFDPNDASNTPADLDGDAIPDALDTDVDGDGYLNETDEFPRDNTEWADLDSDGTGDNADLDRDGDGISNKHETQLGFDPNDKTNTPADLDGDAIPDALDTDIDGDGHLNEVDVFPRDAAEWSDLDSDGTGDNADLDRDGDGISNDYETQLGFDPNDATNTPADLDGDAIPDAIDTDIDGDGYLNEVDAFPRDSSEWSDLDADGMGDNADLDRDGDGISNEHETQLGFDPNDATNTPEDLDGDAIPDALDTDLDGDGHLNEADVFPRDATEWSDLDSDGTGDNADLDRDGDGISNDYETQLGFDPNDASNTPEDLDSDGIPDAVDYDIDGDGYLNNLDAFPRDASEWADLDSDGTGDNSDLDRDGDGISNEYETQLGFDPNDKANTPEDLDSDAIPDALDTDIDGDGHLNEADVFPRDNTEWADLDSDGTGDNADLDRDGDGISNEYEIQLGFDPNDAANTPADLDGDAIPDALDTDIDGDGHLNEADVFPRDASEWADLDSDGTGDNADLDRDGDGISNVYETQLGFDPNDATNTPADLDGDATPDAIDTDIDGDGHLNDADVFPRDATEWADLDSDGTGDNADLDRDGDGISNDYETQLGFDPNDVSNTPADLDGDATPDAIDTDIDGDGHLNEADEFPNDATEWADLDSDGTGDNADLDRDGDGISNDYETQLGFDPNDAANTPADLDGDAIPDALDSDIDGDGHLNEADAFPRDATEWSDLDSDGTGDNTDLDRDGDGISNDYETQLGFDPNDKTNTPADLDGDAIPDALDTDIDGDGHLNEADAFPRDATEWSDLDSDGTGDNADLDRDGDGISNVYETQLGFDPSDKTNTPADLDGDSTPDAIDTDIDGDGHLNEADEFPNDATEWADLDSDGTGDNADLDRDGDGISNEHETQLGFDPNDATNTPADLDGDATPDDLDTDIDGDGYLNEVDAFPRDNTEWADLDLDGIGDNIDIDRDGDGFSNDVEVAAGTDPDDRLSYPDVVAPVIILDTIPSEVQLAQVTISGQVTDDKNDIQKVWINHVNLQNAEFVITLDQTGHFSEVIPLEVDINTFKVNALDGSGNASHVDLSVTYKSPPVVKNLSPANGGVVIVENTVITGQIETEYDIQDIKLFLDGTLLVLTEDANNLYGFESPSLFFVVGSNQLELLIQTPHGSHKTALNYQYLPDGSNDLPLPEIQLLFPAEDAVLAGTNTPYSLIVTSHAGVITSTVNGQGIANPNNQSIIQAKGVLALNQQGDKTLLAVEAKDALGRITSKTFEFSTDNVAPVITWDAPFVNQQTLSVVTSENRISGQVSDANLASLLINNKPVQMQSTDTPGSYKFYFDTQVSASTSETYVAEARDTSGNLSNTWVTVENNAQLNLNWITPGNGFKVFTGQGKINIALSGNNIDEKFSIVARLIPNNSSGLNQGTIQQTSITKQGNWYVGELTIPANVVDASGVDDYKLEVEVLNTSGDKMFVTSRNIQVVDINTETLAIVQKYPQAMDRDIKVDAPLQFTFNQPIDLAKLQVIVKQSVTGQSYVNNDLPQTPYYAQKGDVLQEVFKNKEPVLVNTSILPGDQTAMAYPIERLAFGAKIDVTVLYDQQELERFRYQTQELPTLSRGRVTDAYGQPLSGITVSVKTLGISTKTDSEGSYGFGYENDQTLNSGVYQLEINAGFEDERFNNRFVRANVQKGRINLIDSVALTKMDVQAVFSPLNTNLISLSQREVILDVSDAKLTIPSGYSDAIKAQLIPLSQFTYQTETYKPEFIYQVVPSGVSVEGDMAITIKIPKYLNTYNYLSEVPEGRLAVLLGYNPQENTFGIVGVGKKQGYTIRSVGETHYQQLDVLGYAFVSDEHHILLEKYVAEDISYLQLIQGIE